MRRSPLLLLLLVGCGGHAPESFDAGVNGPAGPPTIQFFSRANPNDAWQATTRSFWGDAVDVRLAGLAPSSAVTLIAASGPFQSTTTYHADASGAVDVATTAPDPGGGYDGVDVDGPFWSMTYDGSGQPLEDYPVMFSVEVEGQAVAAATLDRYWTPDGATTMKVSDSGLVGYYVAPPGTGPFPALITFGGSEGGLGTGQLLAEYYASLGYACLGLAYFGAPGLPSGIQKIPLEYFGTALTWLKARSEVDASRIGVMGGSRGGELALLLGATYPELKAVVATSGSGLVWSGTIDPTQAAWTLGGNDIAFVPSVSAATSTSVDADGNTLYAFAQATLDDLHDASPAALAAATIGVDKVDGSVLMLAGMDDQLWAGCTLSQYAVDRLMTTGHWQAHGDDFVCYADAGHAIIQPGIPTMRANEAYQDGQWFDLGGTPAGTAHAERDADTRIRAFLKQHL
jgi:dienelactone hydrolase